MNTLHEFGISLRADGNWQLGWFSDGFDSAILLLLFLMSVGFVERLESISWAGASVWSFSPASDAD